MAASQLKLTVLVDHEIKVDGGMVLWEFKELIEHGEEKLLVHRRAMGERRIEERQWISGVKICQEVTETLLNDDEKKAFEAEWSSKWKPTASAQPEQEEEGENLDLEYQLEAQDDPESDEYF